MKRDQFTLPRRHLLTAAAIPAALLPASPAFALLDWLEGKAAENRRRRYDAVTDKALVDAMYVMLEDGKQESLVPALSTMGYRLNELTPGMLSMQRYIGNVGDMSGAEERMRALVPDLDTDPVAAVHAEMSKGRGNTVKAYKLPMCRRLNGLFKQPLVFGPGRREWYDRDLPLIEWSPQGRVVSVVVHAFQAGSSLGVTLSRYSTVFFGPGNTRHVENSIRNTEFADFELRVL